MDPQLSQERGFKAEIMDWIIIIIITSFPSSQIFHRPFSERGRAVSFWLPFLKIQRNYLISVGFDVYLRHFVPTVHRLSIPGMGWKSGMLLLQNLCGTTLEPPGHAGGGFLLFKTSTGSHRAIGWHR